MNLTTNHMGYRIPIITNTFWEANNKLPTSLLKFNIPFCLFVCFKASRRATMHQLFKNPGGREEGFGLANSPTLWNPFFFAAYPGTIWLGGKTLITLRAKFPLPSSHSFCTPPYQPEAEVLWRGFEENVLSWSLSVPRDSLTTSLTLGQRQSSNQVYGVRLLVSLFWKTPDDAPFA